MNRDSFATNCKEKSDSIQIVHNSSNIQSGFMSALGSEVNMPRKGVRAKTPSMKKNQVEHHFRKYTFQSPRKIFLT